MKISELLNSPEKWTQRAYARNKDGEDVAITSPEATCFCLWGAILKCSNRPSTINTLYTKVNMAARKLFPNRSESPNTISFIIFNDHPDTTFEDIQLVLKEAGL